MEFTVGPVFQKHAQYEGLLFCVTSSVISVSLLTIDSVNVTYAPAHLYIHRAAPFFFYGFSLPTHPDVHGFPLIPALLCGP